VADHLFVKLLDPIWPCWFFCGDLGRRLSISGVVKTR
jgi:hypothetical protein